MFGRFSTEREILGTLTPMEESAAGAVLYEKAGRFYGSADAEKHVLVSGATRSGKTSRVSVNTLYRIALSGDSAIVVDTAKKELYKATAEYIMKRGSHMVYHLDCTTWESPDSFNPVLEIAAKFADPDLTAQDDAWRDAEQMGRILVAKQPRDAYFEEAGAQFLMGLLLALLELAHEDEELNLSSLQAMCAEALQFVRHARVIDEILDLLPKKSPARPPLSMVANSARETGGSIFSVSMSALNKVCMGNGGIMDVFNDTAPSITLANITRDPFILYITLPEDGTAAIGVLTLAQLINHFIRLADRGKTGRLENTLHIVLEELGVIGEYLKEDLPRYTSSCAGRNIRFTMLCQSPAQLIRIFSDAGARTIRANCGTCIHFADNDPDGCEEISRFCGKHPVFSGDVPGGVVEYARIRPEGVRHLRVGQALILSGGLCYVADLPIYTRFFTPPEWNGEDPICFKCKEYYKVFHPVALVEEKRNAEMEALKRLREETHVRHEGEKVTEADGLKRMPISEAVEEARRRRKHRAQMLQETECSPKIDLWQRAARMFRRGTKEGKKSMEANQ